MAKRDFLKAHTRRNDGQDKPHGGRDVCTLLILPSGAGAFYELKHYEIVQNHKIKKEDRRL